MAAGEEADGVGTRKRGDEYVAPRESQINGEGKQRSGEE